MKVCIRTVFKTENCGSFLQAWALKEALSSMGHDVCFNDYNYSVLKSNVVAFLKCCLRLRFRRAGDVVRKTLGFKNCQKDLKIVNGIGEAGLCFFGSDTLWNFEEDFFVKQTSFFTGEKLQVPCYTYAISVGSTLPEKFQENSLAVRNIQKFKRIAVRDEHTKEAISKVYPCENIIKTVDPTMLIDKEVYIKRFSAVKSCCPKSLLIYYFGDIPEATRQALREFARKKELAIVYVGMHEKGFDHSFVGIPSNFITAFANAEYIFTNTFHGCVFSIIFNKQFATDGVHKKKIESLLEEFALCDRVLHSSDDLEQVLTSSVDYVQINALINEKRDDSQKYLDHAMREVNDSE